MDAQATEIAVFVKNAGKQLIHIIDNGAGMTKDDLILAIKRHATSKLYTTEDLEAILTFGFRGEALASISSVANIEIRTKQADEPHGWKLTAQPNTEPKVEPINCDNGTQIFVRNLFFNIPARRKFLRADLTEFRHISETMRKFAIAHTDKRFTFYDDNNLIFDLKSSTLNKRINDVLDLGISSSMMEVNYSDGIIGISGFLGNPTLAKKTTVNQYLYLNKRPIVNKSISFAVYKAFENLVEKNSKPLFILFLDIDPHRVDINVHPQKHEVKFDDEVYIHRAVSNAVLETLGKFNIMASTSIISQQSDDPFRRIQTGNDDKSFMIVNTLTGEIVEDEQRSSNKNNYYEPSRQGYGSQGGFNKPNNFKNEVSAFEELFKPANITKNEQITIDLDFDISEKNVWQFDNKFIIVNFKNRLLIIDQNKASQRIIYEQIKHRFLEGKSGCQKLMFAQEIDLNNKGVQVINDIEDYLRAIGFEFTITGNLLSITATPPELPENTSSNVINDIIETFEQLSILRMGAIQDNLAAAYSLNTAIKAGYTLRMDEMISIIRNLFKCGMPNLSPRGKKCFVYAETEHLENLFN